MKGARESDSYLQKAVLSPVNNSMAINSNTDIATARGVADSRTQKDLTKMGIAKDFQIAYGAHVASTEADKMQTDGVALVPEQSGRNLPDARPQRRSRGGDSDVRPSDPYTAGNTAGSRAGRPGRRSTTTERNTYGQDTIQWEATYQTILYEWLMDVKSNMFAYNGLPPTVNTRWLEQLLAYTGFASVGLNKAGELVVYGTAQNAGYNPYGDPLSAVSENAWSGGEIQVTDGVEITPDMIDEFGDADLAKLAIQPHEVTRSHPELGTFVTFRNKQTWNNVPATDMGRVEFFAMELANIASLARSVRLKMKTPYLVATRKGQVSQSAVMSAIRGGEEVIQISENLDVNELVQVLRLDVPVDYLPRLKDEFNNKLSEMLTMFGINNIGVDKKERLVSAEAEGNNQLINASGNVYLDSRLEAIELLNLRFGGKVADFDGNATVDWNQATIRSLQGLSLDSVESGIMPSGKTDQTFEEGAQEASQGGE